MTPPPADPVPLPEPACVCGELPEPECPHHGQCAAYGHPCHCDATDAMRLGTAHARGVAEERARVVALVREHVAITLNDDSMRCEGCKEGGPMFDYEWGAQHLADLITRGDHERTPDA